MVWAAILILGNSIKLMKLFDMTTLEQDNQLKYIWRLVIMGAWVISSSAFQAYVVSSEILCKLSK